MYNPAVAIRRGSAVSTRDLLHAVVDRLPDEGVAELYEHARRLEAPAEPPEPPTGGPSLMEKLRAIKIDDLPPDFSENLHEYLYGPKGRKEDVP